MKTEKQIKQRLDQLHRVSKVVVDLSDLSRIDAGIKTLEWVLSDEK